MREAERDETDTETIIGKRSRTKQMREICMIGNRRREQKNERENPSYNVKIANLNFKINLDVKIYQPCIQPQP